MAKLLTAIGLGLILSSTAALAASKADSKKQGSEQQYCLTFEDTGSHLSRTECRTKKEWRQIGVDVDELSSKNGRSEGLA